MSLDFDWIFFDVFLSKKTILWHGVFQFENCPIFYDFSIEFNEAYLTEDFLEMI